MARARAAALVLVTVVAVARPAAAYVRYQTSTGTGFYWPQPCVAMTVYPNDLPDMTPAQILHAASAAAAAWSIDQVACTDLGIQVASSTAVTPSARFDSLNSIIFRRDSWCAPTDAPGACTYDPAMLALTSVFVSTSTGQIRDADIEVNAKYFVWADLDVDPTPSKQDLQNALTHEMGHAIGLDHTCYSPGSTAPRPLDNTGQPIPDCSAASDAVRATTMFPSATPGDTAKRTLAPDDEQAVCDIYPALPDGGTCSASADAGAPPPTDAAGTSASDAGDAASAPDAHGDAQLPPPPRPKDHGGCQCGLHDGAAGRAAVPFLVLAASLTWRRRRRGA